MGKKEDNLIPQAHILTVEEASRGGKASVESRKRSKLAKDIASAMLNSNQGNEEYKKKAIELYNELGEEQITKTFKFLSDIAEILNRVRYEEIVDENGEKRKVLVPYYKPEARIKAFEILRDTAGQKPVEKQEITNIDKDGYRQVLMGDEDIFAGDYGSADESDDEEEDKKE